MFKLVVDRKMYFLWTCEDLCPELFELDDGGISHIIGSKKSRK